MKNQKKLVVLVISFVLVFSTSVPIFANADAAPRDNLPQTELANEYLRPDNESLENDDRPQLNDPGSIIVYGAANCKVSFSKTSATKATASVAATRSGATSITSTIQLQKKSGTSYTNVSAVNKTVGQSVIAHTNIFTISSSQKYRVKVTIKYKNSSGSQSDTFYSSLV